MSCVHRFRYTTALNERGPLRGRHRQTNHECRARPKRTADLDAPAVTLDYAVRDRQTEPRPLACRLGREKRLKDLFLQLGRYPGTGVLQLDQNLPADRARAHRQLPTLTRHGLLSVDGEIHQHLLQLVDVATDLRKALAKVPDDANAVERQLMVDNRQGGADGLVGVNRLELQRFLARKAHQVFDDVDAAPCFPGNQVEAGLGGVVRPEAANRQLRMSEDAGQWVIHLVGNTCAKLPERGHLRRMHQRSLGLYQRKLALLQTRGHPVEGNRQSAHLIGGPRMHSGAEVSLPDALSA